ncbi:MAG: hypothetical protein Tsb0013_11030 [Phycisphaerales bacterium]
MRVLIADKFQASGIQALKEAGCEVESRPDLTPETIGAAGKEFGADILVVRSTKVPAAVFDEAGSISLVIRAGAGYDTIDVDAASKRGVFVANCPGKNSIAVAELAWGLILACDRLIPRQTQDLREGKWDKKGYSKAQGVYGRTLGVIGVGSIGREVIGRAHAFGMPVVAWSRSLTDAKARELGVERAELPVDVARKADIVSLHVASTADTKHLVSAKFLAEMKDGAALVNTTRGAVVDEAALLKAMDEKHIRAGLDVYENEPGASDTASDLAIARHPLFVGTHHVGASTEQAQEAIADETVRIALAYRDTGNPPNVVNREARSRAKRLLVVRHLNKPGVLAHVVGAIGAARINIEEMENIIYAGGHAACARLRLDEEPSPDILESIRGKTDDVISADLTVLNAPPAVTTIGAAT